MRERLGKLIHRNPHTGCPPLCPAPPPRQRDREKKEKVKSDVKIEPEARRYSEPSEETRVLLHLDSSPRMLM